MGEAIGRLNLPTLVVQEGGYTLRNLAIGIYEIQRELGRTGGEGCKSWSRQLRFSGALALLR